MTPLTISIQQTTNNWHKLSHWQYSNSTFSPLSCPLSFRLCNSAQCCLYIISVYPLLCVYYWAGLMLSDVWLVPSPLYLTTLSGPGYNWGSRSLPRSSMSTYHRNNPTLSILVISTNIVKMLNKRRNSPHLTPVVCCCRCCRHCSSSQERADIRFLWRGEGRRHFDDDKTG